MNIFNTEENNQFNFSNSYFFDAQKESFDDSVFLITDEITKENHSDTDSISKAKPVPASASNQTKIRKTKVTKLEKEINKREKDRQRAKRNRDRKKEQFSSLQSKLDHAHLTIKTKEDRIKELELRLAQLESVEISLF